jgi:phosphoesterase RecJ-like protein
MILKMMKVPEGISKAFKRHNNFLITSHVNLEGDAIGSELALATLLKKLGKKSKIINDGKVPDNLLFLSNISSVSNIEGGINNFDLPSRNSPPMRVGMDSEENTASADFRRSENTDSTGVGPCLHAGVRFGTQAWSFNFDAAIVVDVPNLDRTGRMKEILLKVPFIINIDHHISNALFGNVNWVEEKVSSAGEMIYYIYKEANLELNLDIASYIYVAIVTDSGGFRFINTTPATHRIAAELIEKGISPNYIYNELYENNTIAKIKLLGEIFSTVIELNNGEIVWFEIREEMLENFKVRGSELEGIIDFARSVKSAKISLLFHELDNNIVKVGFRSKDKNIDVNKLANYFGGGGHIMASGCKIEGKFDEVKDKVLSYCQSFLKDNL